MGKIRPPYSTARKGVFRERVRHRAQRLRTLKIAVQAQHRDRLWEKVAVAVPYLWLLVFFLAPFAIIFKISLADPIIALPPLTPTTGPDGELQISADNYAFLLGDKLYVYTYLKSVALAATATVFCLLLGYPMALAIARAKERIRGMLLLLIIVPFWISFLLRVYAWIGI